MRVLALDIGQVRCGIALSDPAMKIATPLCVLPMAEVEAHAKSFKRVLEDWEPELIVSGMPYTMSHQQGPQAQRVKALALKIGKNCNLPVEFCDERFSSKDAKRILREQGCREADMRGKVDMIAASLMLQAWLDARQKQLNEGE